MPKVLVDVPDALDTLARERGESVDALAHRALAQWASDAAGDAADARGVLQRGHAGVGGSLLLTGGSLYTGTEDERRAKLAEFHRMLHEWATEDPEYNEQTLSEIRKALNESRRQVGARLLFPEEEP